MVLNSSRTYRLAAFTALLAGAQEALAQRAGWTIEGPARVTPDNPEIFLYLHAWFDYVPGAAEGFYGSVCSVHATEPEFRGWAIPPPFRNGEPIAPRQPTQMGPDGIFQIQWPEFQLFGKPGNPILVYRARWRTTDFTPRRVTFTTRTYAMDVYDDWKRGASTRRIAEPIEEGEFSIQVLPGPCYADCDSTTGFEVLDIFDFLCFQNEFAGGRRYADCDRDGDLTVLDFACFQKQYIEATR